MKRQESKELPLYETSNINTILSQNLKKLMKEKGFSQKTLVKHCKSKNLTIAEGTIFNILHERRSVTLDTLSILAQTLDTDIFTLLTPTDNASAHVSHTPLSLDTFITSPTDDAFKGFMGSFEVYFYKTAGKNLDLLHGTLKFESSSDGTTCIASLSLPTGDTRITDDKEVDIVKEYTGTLIVSKHMQSGYVFLDNGRDISVLIFHHWYLQNNDLKCTMASAITTSSGSNRRPTTHRICITRDPIPHDKIPYIKGQLLLNDADILISQTDYNKLIASKNLPESFRTLLMDAASKEHYRLIKENQLIDSTLFSEHENAKFISQVRLKSIASKYNKISKRTDDSLFAILYKGMENTNNDNI